MKCFQMVGTRETFLGKMKIFGKTFPGRNYPNLRGETEETFYWQVSMAGNNWGGGVEGNDPCLNNFSERDLSLGFRL